MSGCEAPAPPERHQGAVAAFDEQRGVGEVQTDDGRRLFFHCTAVADGSRTIEEGRTVTFEVAPGHLGRWEARDLRRA